MSHTRVIHNHDGKIKVCIIGNQDYSGDMRLQWVEGDVEGHEVVKEVIIPGEVLEMVSKHTATARLKERLQAILEEL